MATVAGHGRLSNVLGTDSALCLLDGEGSRRLTTETPPIRFPAGAWTEARLLEGSITGKLRASAATVTSAVQTPWPISAAVSRPAPA